LTFTNNIKEKLSVIIAYVHLNFGIVLNGLNQIYFGRYKKLTFDVITGFFIFLGLIGYMIVLIYVKWWVPVYTYDEVPKTIDQDVFSVSTSPSIITLVIGDIMGPTGFAEPNNPNLYFFPAQQDISNLLLIITVVCLPLMLCTIPCMAICCGPKHHEEIPDEFQGVQAHNKSEEDDGLLGAGADEGDIQDDIRDVEEMLKNHSPKEEGDHGAGEMFIHQIIETIEFVLGCISNTASYLRLWALSLAHGQLGEVFLTIFFTQTQPLVGGNISESSTVVSILFFFFMGFGYMFAIFCVLFMMDCLEVFLHTMRLHWVEFMGKFYEGMGIPYKPFSFKEVFEKERTRKDTA